jgi:4-hydroxy-tetrahydrodipicolinate synthase
LPTPRPLIHGVVAALGTPLDARENLHEEGMRRQIRLQLRAGVDALLVLGSMGAMQLLKDDTCLEALRVAVDEAGAKVPIIAGCGDTSTERTRIRIRRAEEAGATAIALVPPYFCVFTQQELLRYFTSLARTAEVPLVLYDNPYFTKHDLGFDLIVNLAKQRKIVGLKASGEFLTLRRAAEHFAGSGFAVLSGHSDLFDVALDLGAVGIVDGLFAAAPEIGVEILRASRAGQRAAAAAAQRKFNRLAAIVGIDSVFAGFTAAMNLRGVPGNFAVAPFTPITPEGRRRVAAILAEVGLIH